jgi:hypothetical protein
MTAKAERAAAKAAGLAQYVTGKPCSNGHIVNRRTIDGACRQCMIELKRRKRSQKPGYRSRAEITADSNNAFPPRHDDAAHKVPARTLKNAGKVKGDGKWPCASQV